MYFRCRGRQRFIRRRLDQSDSFDRTNLNGPKSREAGPEQYRILLPHGEPRFQTIKNPPDRASLNMTTELSESSTGGLVFYNQVNRPFMIGITALLVCFGLLMFFVGLDRALGSFQMDDLALLVLGVLFVAIGYLLWRFAMKPRFEICADSIRISNFFGRTTIRFNDIRCIGSFDRKVRPKAYGPSGDPHVLAREITIPMIAVRLKNSKLRMFALPSFSGNQQCLRAITRQSGMDIDDLKDDPGFLRDWGI